MYSPACWPQPKADFSLRPAPYGVGASLGMTGHLEVATATEGSFFLRRIRPSPEQRNWPSHPTQGENGKEKTGN